MKNANFSSNYFKTAVVNGLIQIVKLLIDEIDFGLFNLNVPVLNLVTEKN